MEYESFVNKHVGSWGPYQIRLWLIASVGLELGTGLLVLMMAMAGAAPDWTCLDPGTPANFSTAAAKCDVLANCSNVVFEENITTMVTEFLLYCDRAYYPDGLISTQMVGFLIGALVGGQLAEMFGRKPIVVLDSFLQVGVAQLLSFAYSWQLIMACKFVLGLSYGILYCTNFVLLQEVTDARYRVLIFVVGGWNAALLVFPALQYLTLDWRWYVRLAPVSTFVLIFPYMFLVCESPRWLIQHDKLDRAQQALRYMAEANGKVGLSEAELNKPLLAAMKTDSHAKTHSYWHLCGSKNTTIHLAITVLSWFVIANVGFGLNFNLKQLPGDRHVNALATGLFNTAGVGAILLLSNRCGRRALHQFSLLGCAVAMVAIVVIYKYEEALGQALSQALVVMNAVVATALTFAGWTAVYLYSAELFPTVIRPMCNAVGSFGARIGGILAPMFLYSARSWEALPYLLWIGLLLLNSVLAYKFLPETKNKPLPEDFKQEKWWSRSHKQKTIVEEDSTEKEEDQEI